MRTISTAQAAVKDLDARSEHVKVEVYTTSWVDLASFPGFNALASVEWSESVDDPGPQATISFLRDLDNWSIAPLMSGARANRAAVLLDLGRVIRVSVAVVPADATPAGGDWFYVFVGYIDQIEWADEVGTLTCRGVYGPLQDRQTEDEPVLAFGGVAGAPVVMRVWQPSTDYASGDYILPTEANRNGKFYKCTTPGTTGTTEPTWPAGGTVSDGSVVWTYQADCWYSGWPVEQVIQSLLTWAGTGVTLSTPVSPGWYIKQYKADRGPILDVIRALAMQIGWDIRPKWGGSSFDLTLYQPDRTKAVNDAEFSAADYEAVETLKLDKSGIRNVVRVIYPDGSDLDPTGRARRKTKLVSDSTSISRYGRLFMEISEGDSSQIDSSTEATSMANACLADLKDPKIEHVVRLVNGFPWVELGDLYKFDANGRHYDTAQSLAVFAYSHRAEGGRIETTISCRGKPCGAYNGWHRMAATNNPRKVYDLSVFSLVGALTVTATACVGGVRLDVTGTPNRGSASPEFEYHVSTSGGFTPDSSTLKQITASRSFEATNLIPGVTYYAKVVPLLRVGGIVQRGQPSAQVSFAAGQGAALHLGQGVEWGRLPLNGGFETITNPSGVPDHWQITYGAWGTDWDLLSDGNGVSGDRYLRYKGAGNSTTLMSAMFPISSLGTYTLSVLGKISIGSMGVGSLIRVFYFDYSKSLVAFFTDYINMSVFTGTWSKQTKALSPPASARFAQIEIDVISTVTGVLWLDDFRIQ